MTSPHQDAADLVARLEEERKLCAIMGDTTAHSFLGEISNLIEQQAKALSEAEVERDRQTGFVQRLQTALAFWMPGVDLRLDEATRELAADDACLLAGGIGARDIPCWGEGMLERALAAEARLAEAIKERDEARADALALYQLGADVHVCEHCSAWMTDDERARVDVTLCPREAYGSDRFPDEPCFKHRAWPVEVDRAESRSFLNSVPNKEPK